MQHLSSSRPAWLALTLLVSARSGAQVAAPEVTAPAPAYDPAQLPSFRGKVQQYTLSPRGEIDGLILSDGTEVKTPPHLSTSIAYAVKPGDEVTIHGLRAAALPLWQATSIADHASGRTIVDPGPDVGPGPHGAPRAEVDGLKTLQGSIRMSLHGARGEVNGVLLTDGTVLRLPPQVALNLTALLQPGRVVVARGDELSNPMGHTLEVRAIGTSRDNLSPVDTPPPPSELRGPRGSQPPRPPEPPPAG